MVIKEEERQINYKPFLPSINKKCLEKGDYEERFEVRNAKIKVCRFADDDLNPFNAINGLLGEVIDR